MTPTRRHLLATVGLLLGRAALRHANGLEALQSSPEPGTPGAARLILLGTQGGPNFNTTRGEAANVVVVDGQPYLLDCGYGTLGALVRAGVNHRALAQVFLTHLHDDHSADLPALLVRQWTDGRLMPTTVYGPHGTTAMVRSIVAFGEANATIRLVDEARRVKPAALMHGRDLPATREPRDVFRDGRVVVRAVENTHFPDQSKRRMPYRSLSYRLDGGGRSFVVSGDTAYSRGLVELARGADVFVCEAMDVAAMRRAFDGMVSRGMYADNPEGVWQHIVATHTPLEDAGRMASEAGVRVLVLSHLVPGALSPLPDDAYVAPVRKTFSGQVVVGRDQMVL